jgi:hypothetical protein
LTGRCQEGRNIANNTRLERRGDNIALRYHFTDIVTYHPDGSMTLDSGGWRTVTTKERINWALPRGIHLRQDKGVWFVGSSWFDNGTPYADGMRIGPRGGITGAGKDTPAKDRALKRRVKKFAQLCADSLPLELPDGGDCWHCVMRTEDGTTLGDKVHGTGHLDSHIQEGYVVPSLVYNALKEKGCGPVYFQGAFTGEAGFYADIAKREVKRAVYRYILRRYGFAVN